MARTRATFKQADIVRAVKAARACGLEVARTEIDRDGRITLIHQSLAAEPVNDFDAWKAKRDARAA